MFAESFSVTAAIPAYNEASRIAAAIASVRAQTEPAAEILVVDDGSTDDTARIAASLGARVVTQRNAGIARTRNRLLTEARSPWLAFLDADDVWYPEKLAAVRRAHEARPQAEFISSDFCCVYESGGIAKPSAYATTPQYAAMTTAPLGDHAVAVPGAELGKALAVGNFIGTSTVVVRRDLLVERGTFFDEHLPVARDVFVAEDVEWYLRVLRATDAVSIERVLGAYCWRSGSLASNYGRVRYGDTKLGERVVADPSAYVDGAAGAFVAARRIQLRHAARIYARAHDFARSQEILREAQCDGADARDGAAIALLELAKSPGGRALAAVADRLLQWTRSRKRAA
ncbi:MAG: glycosyltransferase family 2 protein [Candidatus Eremiobacteraeota bacterium]|nr:glycosyltransferase family 2 protein [Candidatus Eremiobacteraeota bacterium]